MNLYEDYYNQLKMQESMYSNLKTVLIDRGLQGNLKITNGTVSLFEKGEKTKTIPVQAFYDTANSILDIAYAHYDKVKDKINDQEYIQEIVSYISYITLLTSRMQKFFSSPTPEYTKLVERTDKKIEEIKKDMPKEFPIIMQEILENDKDKIIARVLKEGLSIDGITNGDALFIIEHIIGKEMFRENIDMFIVMAANNEYIINRLEEIGFVDPNEVMEYLDKDSVLKCLSYGKKCTYLLKYLSKEDYIEAFNKGYIDSKTFSKCISIQDLFKLQIEKEQIIDFLKRKVYIKEASEDVWKKYESGFFDLKEINEICKLGYLNPNTIVKKYLEEHKREIALELKDQPDITDEKLIEFFTPEQILKLEQAQKKSLTPESMLFFRDDLRAIYSQSGRDLERELIDSEKASNEKLEDKRNLLELYTNGLVSLSKFTKDEVSEGEILKLYFDSNLDENILINAYNAGLVSQESVLENIVDTDYIYKLIKENKLNASVIDSYCDTAELIKLYQSEELTLDNIAKLSINSEEIRRMYNNNELAYVELSELAEHGIISQEEANEIKESYDIKADLELLRKKGGIIGLDLEKEKNPNGVDPINPDDRPDIPDAPIKSGEIDEELKRILFEALGSGEAVSVRWNLFKGYKMYPFTKGKLRLAVLEGGKGDGATYILPLKMVLEQVRGELGIFGRAVYRRDLTKDDENVRTAMHTKNWGKNIIKKMVELTPGMTQEEIVGQNKEFVNQIVSEIANSYDKSKEHQKNK